MSLIEEALRKQREETEQGQSAKVQPVKVQLAPPLPLPPPVPAGEDTTTSDPPESRWTWRLLAGIGAVSLLLVAGIVWLLLFGLKISHTKPEGKTPNLLTVTTLTTTNVKSGAVAGQTPQTNATGESAGSGAPTNMPDVTESGAVAVPSQIPSVTTTSAPPVFDTNTVVVSIPASNKAPDVVRIGAVIPTAATSSAEKAQTMMATWPRLTVTGIIGTTRGNRGAAIVNGQMLSVGGAIEGVKVIAIDKQGVQFRFGRETRTLMVGGTTE